MVSSGGAVGDFLADEQGLEFLTSALIKTLGAASHLGSGGVPDQLRPPSLRCSYARAGTPCQLPK